MRNARAGPEFDASGRDRDAGRRAVERDLASCPSCGAPIRLNQAARCSHCDAAVTSGDFDWVLTRIEQDEAYTGG